MGACMCVCVCLCVFVFHKIRCHRIVYGSRVIPVVSTGPSGYQSHIQIAAGVYIYVCACVVVSFRKDVGMCVFLWMYAGLSNYKHRRRVIHDGACMCVCVCLLSLCMLLKKLTYFEREEDVVP